MRSIDDDMMLISKRVLEQSNALARIVDESNILRATSDKLCETVRAQLRMIKLELGEWSAGDERDSSSKRPY